jgi:hypothetical protein
MKKFILAAPTMLILTFAVGATARAQEPANPVQFHLSCNIPSGQSQCSAQVSLPPGKRIVLETVSASASAPPPQQISLSISTTSATLPSGSAVASHFVVLTPTPGPVMSLYFANHRIRMYGQAGSIVSIHGQRLNMPNQPLYPGVVNFWVSLSGYLLP